MIQLRLKRERRQALSTKPEGPLKEVVDFNRSAAAE
jgi:hypothetical protein